MVTDTRNEMDDPKKHIICTCIGVSNASMGLVITISGSMSAILNQMIKYRYIMSGTHRYWSIGGDYWQNMIHFHHDYAPEMSGNVDVNNNKARQNSTISTSGLLI